MSLAFQCPITTWKTFVLLLYSQDLIQYIKTITIIIHSTQTQRGPGNMWSSLAEPSICFAKLWVILACVLIYERGDDKMMRAHALYGMRNSIIIIIIVIVANSLPLTSSSGGRQFYGRGRKWPRGPYLHLAIPVLLYYSLCRTTALC